MMIFIVAVITTSKLKTEAPSHYPIRASLSVIVIINNPIMIPPYIPIRIIKINPESITLR